MIKLKWKGITTTLLFLILAMTIVHTTKMKNIKYKKEVITIMREQNILNEITKKDYSKTVEKMIEDNQFQEEYLNNYYEINYQEKENWSSFVNLLLEKNYSSLEINNIFEYLNDSNIEKLIHQDYIELGDYIKVGNVEIDKIDRYKNYQKNHHTNLQETVTLVNIGLDEEFYKEVKTIENPDSYTVLVNKYRALPDFYTPTDLKSLSINKNMKLREHAADAYEQLQNAALLDQVIIIPFSSYRTKDYQNKLYVNYVNRDGITIADTYSARPRHSEHETGLAIDIRSNTLIDNLTENDYKWMLNNSYKYGFIVRYAYATSAITGYMEEPWHLRYVGIDIATDIHEKNITFDEYYDLYLKEKENTKKN